LLHARGLRCACAERERDDRRADEKASHVQLLSWDRPTRCRAAKAS
jgi:hypothetical protein